MKKPKHHYLPVFYLRQWAGADGRLCEMSRPRREGSAKPRRTHPDGTGYTRGLYTAAGVSGEIANVVESRFMQVADSLAATVLQRQFLATPAEIPLNGEQRSAWARFIVSLTYRNPENVQRATHAVQKIFDEMDEDIRGAFEEENPGSDYEEFKRQTRIGSVSRFAMEHLMTIIDSKRLVPAIMSMKWVVGQADKIQYPLLTSDRPLMMSGGIGHRDSNIIMPISPNRVFIAARSDEMLQRIREDFHAGGVVPRLNEAVVRQARKYVYGSDDRQLRFVDRRLGERAWCTPFEPADDNPDRKHPLPRRMRLDA